MAQVAGCNFRGGLLDALQRRHRVLDDQRGQGAAEQHHGDADHNAVSGECVDGVDLVGQRQADVHHGTVLAVLLEGHRCLPALRAAMVEAAWLALAVGLASTLVMVSEELEFPLAGSFWLSALSDCTVMICLATACVVNA